MSPCRLHVTLLALNVAGCGRLGFADEVHDGGSDDADGEAWFDPAETHRTRLVLDRATFSSDLDRFPLLVTLDPQHFDRAAARSDLRDLQFVLDNLVLPSELEAASDATTILAWVEMPHVAAGTHPTLYAYYGGPARPAPEEPWAPSYVGAWHLDSGHDSSPAGNDGTVVVATPVAGRIGMGMNIPATGVGYLRVDDDPSLHWSSGRLTVSAWVRLRTYRQSYGAVIAREVAATGITDDFYLGVGNQMEHGQMTTLVYGGPLPLATWHHLGMVYDGATITLYNDGTKVGSGAFGGPMGSSPKPIYLGADCNGTGNVPDDSMIDGTIDEIRVESVSRSADWMAADHASQTDGLITYGPIEEIP